LIGTALGDITISASGERHVFADTLFTHEYSYDLSIKLSAPAYIGSIVSRSVNKRLFFDLSPFPVIKQDCLSIEGRYHPPTRVIAYARITLTLSF